MANFFSKLISSGASSLVDAVGTAIDKTFTSKEEKMSLENEMTKAKLQHDIELATLSEKEKEALYGDINSARENQTKVQESSNASWLSKNIQSILALSTIGITFWLYWYIIFGGHNTLKEQPEMKDIIIYILGAPTTVSTQVASYFFGSSQGSADKSKTISELAKNV